MKKICVCAVTFLIPLVLQACGGGGSAGVVSQEQKTATVVFATTTSDATVKLRGISVVATLPDGVTVATKAGTDEISSGALQGVGQVATGTYSAATRQISIVNMPTGNDLAIGPFARVICDVTPGKTLQESQFASIVPLDFQPTGPQGIDLTLTVTPKISVSFGY